MCSVETVIKTAPEAYKLLQGFVCVNKPADWGIQRVYNTLQLALCNDLNAMEQRPIRERVEITGSLKDENFKVMKVPSVADNPLVMGPRYEAKDLSVEWISKPPFMSSGVCLLRIRPSKRDFILRRMPMVSTYHICCELGATTDDGTTTGRIRERSRFHHVHQGLLERFCSSVQASFQRQAFEFAGVDVMSQEAFELASAGLVRPQENSAPVVYSLRCIEFDSPSFTLELQVINEREDYIRSLVCDLALKLRTTAAIAKLRRVRFGHFTLDQALIKNQWTVENIIENIQETAVYIDQWRYPNLLGEADPCKKNLTLLKRI